MCQLWKQKLIDEFVKWPKSSSTLTYGTAGYRLNYETRQSDLERIIFSCSLVACICSYESKSSVGIMITASHNPSSDNGLKLISPNGKMLSKEFELMCTKVASCDNVIDFIEESLLEKYLSEDDKVKFMSGNIEDIFGECCVVIGMDTRYSSPKLSDITKTAVKLFGARFIDSGELTTPMLHFVVMHLNTQAANMALSDDASKSALNFYFDCHSYNFDAFLSKLNQEKIRELFDIKNLVIEDAEGELEEIIVDCANGVGSNYLDKFNPILNKFGSKLTLINTETKNFKVLNYLCGSDYVQKKLVVPNSNRIFKRNDVCACLDGDADRIVFFVVKCPEKNEIALIDGDRLASAFAFTICRLLVGSMKNCVKPDNFEKLTFSVVQTAYANSSSTSFMTSTIKSLLEPFSDLCSWELACTATGVKYLDRKAEQYDISIYFEANGHGTVISNVEKINKWANSLKINDSPAFELLLSFLSILNPTIGDSFTIILALEAARRFNEYKSMNDLLDLYSDLTVKQDKISLSRDVLNTIIPDPLTEKFLVQPKELQSKIDEIIAKYNPARVFIRPSGTEDVCRIYVEAENSQTADIIVEHIRELVLTATQ